MEELQYAMEKESLQDIVITKERLSTNKNIFVAHCTSLGIASQGKDPKEARKNIQEAIQRSKKKQELKISIPNN